MSNTIGTGMGRSGARTLVDPATVLVGWTRRRIADNGRAGTVPGLRKVGSSWMLDLDTFGGHTQTEAKTVAPPTDEEARAMLAARGIRCAS